MNFSSFLAKVMPGKVLQEYPKHPISISWKITRNMEPFLDLVKLFSKLPGISSLNREMAWRAKIMGVVVPMSVIPELGMGDKWRLHLLLIARAKH